MNTNWLFLRFFDESKDRPIEQLHPLTSILTIVATAAVPVFFVLSLIATSSGSLPGTRFWMLVAVVCSAAITVQQFLNKRPGHAANQAVLTGLITAFLLLLK